MPLKSALQTCFAAPTVSGTQARPAWQSSARKQTEPAAPSGCGPPQAIAQTPATPSRSSARHTGKRRFRAPGIRNRRYRNLSAGQVNGLPTCATIVRKSASFITNEPGTFADRALLSEARGAEAAGAGSLQVQQQIALFDGLSGAYRNARHAPRARSLDRHLHLHRLQDQELLIERDRISDLHQNLPNRSGNVRQNPFRHQRTVAASP